MKKATQQQTKEHNRNLVLKTIFDYSTISRIEIARLTSLTRTTVSDIVADLIAEGLVNEIGMGSSSGGKSPILLSLLEDSRYLIGLDLAHNQFRGAVINLRGRVREMVTRPVNKRNASEALGLVFEILDRLMETTCKPLVGIGVGTPGLVNTEEGVVVSAVNLDWENLPLAQLIHDRYHLPAFILNDSQAAAMGEFTYGKDHKTDNHLVVVNVGLGIGAGIVLNGHLFQGDGGGAGEIGHVVSVPEGGLPCRCGNYGCLETVASAQAVTKRIQVLSKQNINSQIPKPSFDINLDTIEQSFQKADPVARQVILEAGRQLGAAIAGLVGALNVQKIVLVGEMTRFGQPWLEAVRETMLRSSLPRLAHDTRVEIGQLGENVIILGASALLANNYSLLLAQQTYTKP